MAFNDLYKSLLDSILEDGSVLSFFVSFFTEKTSLVGSNEFLKPRKGLGLVVLEVDD